MKVRGTPDQNDGVCLRSKRSDSQNPSISRGKSSALRGKRLFLDLKGQKGQVSLENNLKRLGAVIEKCFSKEIEWLITNQGKADDYKKIKKSEGDHERLDYVPSPFNLGHAGIDSPQAPSPNSSQATKPITRGKAIAQAANLTKTYGSSNLVDNARRWGIRIVHIETAQKWVDYEIKRYRECVKLAEAEKKSQVAKVKRLKPPYVKFETLGETYRPVYEVLAHLPVLHFMGESIGSPFEAWQKRGRHDAEKEADEPAEAEERDIFVKDQPLLSSEKESKATDSINVGKNARSEKKRTDAQPQLVTAGELRRRTKDQYEKQTGYCEMCNLRYDDIDKHVLLDQHRRYVRNAKNYKALDAAIQENLTMVEVIKEMVKHQAVANISHSEPKQCSELQEDATANSILEKLSHPSIKRQTRGGKVIDVLSPEKPNSEALSLRQTPNSRLRQKLEKKLLASCEQPSNFFLEEVKILSVSSVAELHKNQRADTKCDNVNPVSLPRPSASKLMSPRTARRRSARNVSLVPAADPMYTEAKSPAPGPSSPTTPLSSRRGRNLLSRDSNRRSLRNRSLRDHKDSRSTPIKRHFDANGSTDELCVTSVKENTEVTKPAESVEDKFESVPGDSLSSTPKYSANKVLSVTPKKCDPPKQSTPQPGSDKKVYNRKVRKLTLKKTMSLASDHSMQKLLEDDDDDVFEGFDQNDLNQTAKNSLSYENVNEVVVDVDTLSDKEWDYEDIEKIEDEKVEQNAEIEKAEDEDALDLGSVIQSIGNIGDQSEGDWDEHLESFICDQLTKKQDCSATTLDLSATQGLGAKRSPLKVVLKSPKKISAKPEDMFIYLSPRKKQSPRKLLLSPVKLSKSAGKLIWNPHEKPRQPLHEMNNKVYEQKGETSNPDNETIEQGGAESVWKEDRQRFIKNYRNPARNRFLSPSSGSVLSPSARSRLHRSLFTSPSEFEDELWSGPATDDKTKFAKEGNYYKPSTPKLSVSLKENKSSTPKSYLRHFKRHFDSEGEKTVIVGDESSPQRREKRLLSRDMASPATSASVLDTSVYNMTDASVNETDVKIDDDISFNFSSPQKVKPSKIRRLNSDSGTPGRCPVDSAWNTSGQGSFQNQKDWLDDLDDPNLGNKQTVKEKSIFKHSPRTKKSYNFNYAAAAESKLPHWRKKYAHMNKAKLKNASKSVLSTRLSKRLARNSNKEETLSGNEEKIAKSEKDKIVNLLKKGKLGKEKTYEAVNFPTPNKSEAASLGSLNTSGAGLNTSGAPSDAPVSPRTRRNLLALVLGIRQHNKVPVKEAANTSGIGSETGKETESSAADKTETISVPPVKDFSINLNGTRSKTDLAKMQSLKVSLQRLPSPDVKGRPTRACRRLLNS